MNKQPLANKKQTAFRLDEDLLNRLKIAAKKENRSLNNYVESVLMGIVYLEPKKETSEAMQETEAGNCLAKPDLDNAENVVHEKKTASSDCHLDVPGQATRILLHSCCAPCSSAVIECMLENRLKPTVFYFNPNIYPQKEYERRKAENIRFVESLHLPFVDGDYDHDGWKERVKGLENEPERGRRCLACFKIRMKKVAQYAAEHAFTVFATTLAASRWKSLEQIAEAGHDAASLYPNLTFWAQNWRKGGLNERRSELIRLHGLYNQTWCGCEFSITE